MDERDRKVKPVCGPYSTPVWNPDLRKWNRRLTSEGRWLTSQYLQRWSPLIKSLYGCEKIWITPGHSISGPLLAEEALRRIGPDAIEHEGAIAVAIAYSTMMPDKMVPVVDPTDLDLVLEKSSTHVLRRVAQELYVATRRRKVKRDEFVHISIDAAGFNDGEEYDWLEDRKSEYREPPDLSRLLGKLAPTDRVILEMAYGINCPEMTYTSISQMYGVSNEAVRQRVVRTIRKLYRNLHVQDMHVEVLS